MNEEGFINTLKSYNKYKKKHISTAGIIISIFLWSIVIFISISFVAARIVQNSAFGIMIGGIFSFYIILQSAEKIKSIIKVKTEKAKQKYCKNLKVKRLYELSEAEYCEAVISYINSKDNNCSFIKQGIFYKYEDTAIVFLTLPNNKSISIDKICMAIKQGAKKIIVISNTESKELIRRTFPNKNINIIIDEDIASNLEFLDYNELNIPKKINYEKIFNKSTSKKFIRMSLLCLIPCTVLSFKSYFGGLSIIFFTVGIFILIINSGLKRAK